MMCDSGFRFAIIDNRMREKAMYMCRKAKNLSGKNRQLILEFITFCVPKDKDEKYVVEWIESWYEG